MLSCQLAGQLSKILLPRPTFMTNVLVADELAIVRYGTTHILQEQFPGTRVTTAGDVDEMVMCLEQSKFDLLILDIDLTGKDCGELLDTIRQKQPGLRILMFSGYIDMPHAMQYVAAGAQGILLKSESERKLKEAITAIFKENTYLSEGFRDIR